MHFLYPQFLWALFCIAIPIAIHLFNFKRYKKVFFSDVRLLKEVQKQSKKRKNLKELLILASRILAITFLVLAFAQPQVQNNDIPFSKREKSILYIDNSPSMLLQGSNGEHLNLAIQKALQMVRTFNENHQFKLLTNHKTSYQWLSKSQVIDEIQKVLPSNQSMSVAALQAKIALAKGSNGNVEYFLFSDLQKSQFNELPFDKATYVLIPMESSKGNISIDSVWTYSPILMPGFGQKIFAKIHNHGLDETKGTSVELIVDEENSGVQVIDLPASSSKVVRFDYVPIKAGWSAASVSLNGPIFSFDDIYRFSLYTRGKNNIAVISDEETNSVLTNYFNDSITSLTRIRTDQIQQDVLQHSDLVILDHIKRMPSFLADFIKSTTAANVLVLPNYDAEIESYNQLFRTLEVDEFAPLDTQTLTAQKVHDKDPFFQGAFNNAPGKVHIKNIKAHFPRRRSSTLSGFNLITMPNGHALARRYQGENRLFVILHAGLTAEYGTWYNHQITLPLLYQSAIIKQNNLPFSIKGQTERPIYVKLPEYKNDVPLKVSFEEADFIPRQQQIGLNVEVSTLEGFDKTGYYYMQYNNELKSIISVNTPRLESEVVFWSEEEISRLSNHSHFLNASDDRYEENMKELFFGKKYWKQCLILALLFLAIEIALIKFWKTHLV